MQAYLDVVRNVLANGKTKSNRTGVETIAIPGAMVSHDMSLGFPCLTTKRVPFRVVAVELEGFVKGVTDKRWFQDRQCRIWDEWCNPEVIPYGHDDETRKWMREERDLGPIYGFQWRHFGADYRGIDCRLKWAGIDQLRSVVETLNRDPNDRRMVVSAWNPMALGEMALPPCHLLYQVTVIDGKLNLFWYQRSVDVALGLPFNIASYGLLLHLLAKEAKLQEGTLVGFLADVHVYRNHVEGLKVQLERMPGQLPSIVTDMFTSVFEWQHHHSRLEGYQPQPTIPFDVAV